MKLFATFCLLFLSTSFAYNMNEYVPHIIERELLNNFYELNLGKDTVSIKYGLGPRSISSFPNQTFNATNYLSALNELETLYNKLCVPDVVRIDRDIDDPGYSVDGIIKSGYSVQDIVDELRIYLAATPVYSQEHFYANERVTALKHNRFRVVADSIVKVHLYAGYNQTLCAPYILQGHPEQQPSECFAASLDDLVRVELINERAHEFIRVNVPGEGIKYKTDKIYSDIRYSAIDNPAYKFITGELLRSIN
jgi:hypothetical protein